MARGHRHAHCFSPGTVLFRVRDAALAYSIMAGELCRLWRSLASLISSAFPVLAVYWTLLILLCAVGCSRSRLSILLPVLALRPLLLSAHPSPLQAWTSTTRRRSTRRRRTSTRLIRFRVEIERVLAVCRGRLLGALALSLELARTRQRIAAHSTFSLDLARIHSIGAELKLLISEVECARGLSCSLLACLQTGDLAGLRIGVFWPWFSHCARDVLAQNNAMLRGKRSVPCSSYSAWLRFAFVVLRRCLACSTIVTACFASLLLELLVLALDVCCGRLQRSPSAAPFWSISLCRTSRYPAFLLWMAFLLQFFRPCCVVR